MFVVCLFDVLSCANYLLPRDGRVDSYFCLMFSIKEEGTPPAGEVGPAHERLALHILHTFNLVPEHIETRSLYSPVQPDIEQVRQSKWCHSIFTLRLSLRCSETSGLVFRFQVTFLYKVEFSKGD